MAECELSAIQLSTLDELTNIPNRRGFFLIGQQSLNICARQQIPASLVYLDLDNFKLINDTFGHTQGDYALITFAKQISAVCRQADIFARLGGDEFVILFINAPNNFAESIIVRLQQALNKNNKKESHDYDISFSYGIVEFSPDKHDSIETLLQDADSIMYEIKKKKNQ